MHLNPYLQFDGRCQAAFKFYERCLGGKIEFVLTNGESPMAAQVPAELHKRIMHARMTIGDQVVMGSDAPPERYEGPQGFSMSLGVEEPAEAERVFRALAQDGTVRMPLQETFWARRFGMLIDQFGIPWMINCERES